MSTFPFAWLCGGPGTPQDGATSRRAVMLQQFHHVAASTPLRPCQRRGPWLVAGQVGPRSAFQEELDHPAAALRLLGVLRCATRANSRGQGAPLELDFAGVDVGAGI